MPLGTALSAGLQSFTAVRGEQRKQQMHDLQTEGLSLRNQGYELSNQGHELSNRYDQETFDDRARNVRRGADNSDAIASINELKLKFEEDTFGLRYDQQAANTRNASNNAANSGYIAGQNRLVLDRERANHVARTNAEGAGYEADLAEARTRSAKGFQEYSSTQLAPVLNSAQTVDDLFSRREAQAMFATQAEGVYGDQLREKYGDKARVLGVMPEGDIARILIDQDGDGQADSVARDVPIDQFLMEAFGEEQGQAHYRRLTGGSELVGQIGQEGVQQAQNVVNDLTQAREQEQFLGENAETLEYMNTRLSDLQAEREQLQVSRTHTTTQQTTEGVGAPQQTTEGAQMAPASPAGQQPGMSRDEREGRLEEIEEELSNLRTGAKQLGIDRYLGNGGTFAQDQEQAAHNVQRLNQSSQTMGGQIQNRQRSALSGLRQGQTPDEIRTTTGVSSPARNVGESRTAVAEYVDSVPDVINADALIANRTFEGEPDYTDRDVLDIQHSAQSWTTSPQGQEWLTKTLAGGPRGKMIADQTMRDISRVAADRKIPFHSAADALTGDYREVAEEALAFRQQMEDPQTQRNRFAGMTDAQRSRALDRMQHAYGRLLMDSPNITPEEAQRRVMNGG